MKMTKLDHKGIIATLCTAVLAAVLLALAVTAPADAAFPGTNGRIAYYTGGDVWTMNADGTDPTRLTTNYNAESNPAVSPDGSRIAYEYLHGIWVMNSDGSGKRAVTDGTASDEDPTWSADGTRIAFARNGDIWAVNVDGSGATNLTNSSNNQELDPAWSPRGDKIAYTRIGCDPSNFGAVCVYSMNADGTGQTNLTPETSMTQCPNQPGYFHNGASREPAWSPDGSLIAFSGALACPNTLGRDIWVMSATGSAKTNLTNDNGTNDKRPSFSPDGTRILFESDRGSTNIELYTMSAANGSGLQRLTNNGILDENPDWGVARPQCATTDGAPNSSLQGTASADTLTGTPGNDIICGLEGNDTIDGGGGNDIILGDAGNDRLVGAADKDTLNGGAGTDTASFAGSTQSIEASLVSGFAKRAGTTPEEGVALVGIENITGSSLGDTLSGSGDANTLTGGKGADELLGLGGNDRLDSRDGINRNDSLNGGAGTNRCITDTREASIRNCS
jgi:Tol biopolymer transport system component